jgi:hypothetical protein
VCVSLCIKDRVCVVVVWGWRGEDGRVRISVFCSVTPLLRLCPLLIFLLSSLIMIVWSVSPPQSILPFFPLPYSFGSLLFSRPLHLPIHPPCPSPASFLPSLLNPASLTRLLRTVKNHSTEIVNFGGGFSRFFLGTLW